MYIRIALVLIAVTFALVNCNNSNTEKIITHQQTTLNESTATESAVESYTSTGDSIEQSYAEPTTSAPIPGIDNTKEKIEINFEENQNLEDAAKKAKLEIGDAAMLLHYSINSEESAEQNINLAINGVQQNPNSIQSHYALVGTLLCKGQVDCVSTYTNDVQIDDLLNDCSDAMNGCSFEHKELIGESILSIYNLNCRSSAQLKVEGTTCNNINEALVFADETDPLSIADKTLAAWVYEY